MFHRLHIPVSGSVLFYSTKSKEALETGDTKEVLEFPVNLGTFLDILDRINAPLNAAVKVTTEGEFIVEWDGNSHVGIIAPPTE